MSVRTSRAPSAVSALSERLETRLAAREVAEQLQIQSKVRPDILVVFGTYHHRALFSDALELLRSELHPVHLLASTAEGVVGDAREVERSAGLTALALRLPGAEAHPFSFSLTDGPASVWSDGLVRSRVVLPPDRGELPHRGILMLADPFSLHAGQVCAAIERAAGPGSTRIFGGIASGASLAGLNVLGVDRRTASEGVVGLSLYGDVAIDGIVSQGCKPMGPCFVVTKARGNEILELGGRRAVDAVREVVESLADADRACVAGGLHMGVAHDASRERLGRGDFLVRPVLGIDDSSGGIGISDIVKPGSTVRLHARDANIAHADLGLLLDAEQLRDPPAAALLFTSSMRGARLFGTPDHDASLVSSRLRSAAMAGFHCAGEFGPIGPRSFVHTQSASIAIFRAAGGATRTG